MGNVKCIARLLVVGFFLVGATSAQANSKQSCDAWEFHNLVPGMSRAEFKKLYKAKNKAVFIGNRVVNLSVVQSPGRFKASVRFDGDRLAWVAFDFPDGFLGLKGPERSQAILAALQKRLGRRFDEDYRVRDSPWIDFLLDTSVIFQFDHVTWISEECNTAVVAVTASFRTILGESGDTVMTVYDLDRLVKIQQELFDELADVGNEFLEPEP